MSLDKLKIRYPPASTSCTAVTTWILEQSAPAAANLGTMVSAGLSSAERMIVFFCGAIPSLQGQRPCLLSTAAMYADSCDLPKPGSPPTSVVLPTANRPCQSHSTGSISISDAHLMTSRLVLAFVSWLFRFGPCGCARCSFAHFAPIPRSVQIFSKSASVMAILAFAFNMATNVLVISTWLLLNECLQPCSIALTQQEVDGLLQRGG